MDKREIIVKLYAASQLLKEAEAAMEQHRDIEEYLRIDVHQAYDIAVMVGHHLSPSPDSRRQTNEV